MKNKRSQVIDHLVSKDKSSLCLPTHEYKDPSLLAFCFFGHLMFKLSTVMYIERKRGKHIGKGPFIYRMIHFGGEGGSAILSHSFYPV